eukprot:1961605-Pleurochrysis_carterae.AAC.1
MALGAAPLAQREAPHRFMPRSQGVFVHLVAARQRRLHLLVEVGKRDEGGLGQLAAQRVNHSADELTRD